MFPRAICLASILCCACTETPPKVEVRLSNDALTTGWYRGALRRPPSDLEIPFLLSLPDSGSGVSVISNGKHWFHAAYEVDGTELTIRFPVVSATIEASIEGDRLVGHWKSEARAVAGGRLKFSADRVAEASLAARFKETTRAEAEVSGIWRVEFETSGVGTASFEQQEDGVSVTLFLPNGDSHYLYGGVFGQEGRLSGFDGGSPYLMTFDAEDRRLTGKLLKDATLKQESFTAHPARKNFRLAPSVRVESADRRLHVPELEHARYSGHPVVLQIVGSWCVHCTNAAPFMRELHERFGPRGLEILTLNYELTDDRAYNLRRKAALMKHHDVSWEVATREGAADEIWKILPPGLAGDTFPAFPITIFLGRDRTVHALHAGFVGKESAQEYEDLTTKMTRWAEEIVAR